MVTPVEHDSRGIVNPGAGLARFRLHRHCPSPPAARFVDRYWVVSWDLTGQPPHQQRVLPHPVVNVVFESGSATAYGVTTGMTVKTLEGRGRALGVMFRPAGFRPFLGRAASTFTDRSCPARDALGFRMETLAQVVSSAADENEIVSLVDAHLAGLVPGEPQRSEQVSEIVELAARDPVLMRVDDLARAVGVGVRQLQRLFAEHVGVGPKWVIRRYRLYEAVERAARGADVDWAGLAGELGYADQAHLVRDFSASVGMSPRRYARGCTESSAAG